MSQNEPVVVTVGDDTYEIFKLDPFLATDLVVDVFAIVAPALGAIGDGMKNGDDDGEAATSIASKIEKLAENGGPMLERAATLFFERMTKNKQRELINLMMGVTNVVLGDKTPTLKSIFATHFLGRPDALYAWLLAALKVQLGPLAQRIAPAIKNAVQAAGLARSSSPRT